MIKHGIVLRLQELEPESVRLFDKKDSYTIFCCFIDKNKKLLGNSFMLLFPKDSIIEEMKARIVDVALNTVKTLSMNGEEIEISDYNLDLFIFKIDDNSDTEKYEQVNGWVWYNLSNPEFHSVYEDQNINEFYSSDKLDYILLSNIEDHVSNVAIKIGYKKIKAPLAENANDENANQKT